MGLYLGGLIIGRIFASEIWGAYFREALFFGGLIIGILRYFGCPSRKKGHVRQRGCLHLYMPADGFR